MTERQGAARFPTTRWSRVLAAGGSDTAGKEALAALCAAYWYPLYAFARRSGREADRALDITQGFFARLVEKNDLVAVDRSRGRFRSWLLASLKHFMANEWDRERAQKRGGHLEAISFEAAGAEERFAREAPRENDPELLFDHQWAVRLIERSVAALEERCRTSEERAVVDVLAPYLAGREIDGEYERLAADLQTTPGALKTRLSRLRERFWMLVRAEVAETLENPEEVDEELRHLIAVLSAAWRV